jgi:topoisomerase IA-like protein
MPIGKNAIKRVENNGYSNVKTEAPDMVNSTVIGATSEQVMNMVESQVENKVEEPKKEEVKKPSAKKTTAKKTVAKKPAKKSEEKPGKSYACGEELPIYLL